ncbi:hypothetical protein RRG08_012282 [Elysia crispata]|uniref:Uncharacterized protein n=1 Tax=Elysia crispata TaxID=231223 RepID=A0AAE1BCJ8_9GAST|nr:hypothetical protein RRG08_012282 [Elysia crispata]
MLDLAKLRGSLLNLEGNEERNSLTNNNLVLGLVFFDRLCLKNASQTAIIRLSLISNGEGKKSIVLYLRNFNLSLSGPITFDKLCVSQGSQTALPRDPKQHHTEIPDSITQRFQPASTRDPNLHKPKIPTCINQRSQSASPRDPRQHHSEIPTCIN